MKIGPTQFTSMNRAASCNGRKPPTDVRMAQAQERTAAATEKLAQAQERTAGALEYQNFWNLGGRNFDEYTKKE